MRDLMKSIRCINAMMQQSNAPPYPGITLEINEEEMTKWRQKQIKDLEELRTKEMLKADIQTEKKLKKLGIKIDNNGGVLVIQEMFREPHIEYLPFVIKDRIIYKLSGDTIRCGKLKLSILDSKGEEQVGRFSLHISRSDQILKEFRDIGMMFNYSELINRELAIKLLAEIINSTKIVEVPMRHGFYVMGNSAVYFGPETITWKEVEAWAQ